MKELANDDIHVNGLLTLPLLIQNSNSWVKTYKKNLLTNDTTKKYLKNPMFLILILVHLDKKLEYLVLRYYSFELAISDYSVRIRSLSLCSEN